MRVDYDLYETTPDTDSESENKLKYKIKRLFLEGVDTMNYLLRSVWTREKAKQNHFTGCFRPLNVEHQCAL